MSDASISTRCGATSWKVGPPLWMRGFVASNDGNISVRLGTRIAC
jgi:hypothetical protein